MFYDESVGSFVLNADYFSKVSKPAFEVIFSDAFSISFDIDFRISDSC